MKLTFQEKSIWVSLLSTLIIFGYYFVRAFTLMANAENALGGIIELFIDVVVLIIVVEVVLHIVLVVANKPEKKDERDTLIELKATRIAYYVLVAGVMSCAFSLVFSTTLVFANTILFFFVLAEVVKQASQLIYYRRGV